MKTPHYKRYIGIDYSMTSPPFTILTEGSSFVENHFIASTKKQQGQILKSDDALFVGHVYPVFADSIAFDRYASLAVLFLDIIKPTKNDLIAIEGYSMASTGLVFNIAENTAVLKYMLYEKELKWTEVPPTTLKKFGTDKGNADKLMMYESFVAKSGFDPRTHLKSEAKLGSPFSDIADSYHLADWLRCQGKRAA